ncbi:MAG: hypothetical protein IT167_25645 [Bryobacterales bacterium]|nr:hypothetical protein [Bryobacterales bacterium]
MAVLLAGAYGSSAQSQNQPNSTAEMPNQESTFSAGGTGTSEKVPNVVLFNSSIRVLKGVYKAATLKNGQKVAPACVFTLSLTPTEKSLQANAKSPLRVNPDGTCEADFEIGEPPQELLAWSASLRTSLIESKTVANPSNLPKLEGSISSKAGASVLLDGPPGFTQSAGYQNSWFVDPIGIVVNSVYTQTTWWWYAPDTCIIPQSGQYQRTWFSLSGWSLGYENWINGAACGYTTSYATDTFINNGFPACLGGTVYAYYWPSAVWGQWDGTLTGQFAWSLSGPACINLLTPQFQLVRTI